MYAHACVCVRASERVSTGSFQHYFEFMLHKAIVHFFIVDKCSVVEFYHDLFIHLLMDILVV